MHTVHFPVASGRRLEGDEAEAGDDAATGDDANPDGPFPVIAAAMGIMFDVDDYDPTVTVEERRVIDQFFDSMGFTTDPPT